MPQTLLEELTALHRPPGGFKGPTSNGEGKGKERRVETGQQRRQWRDRK